MDDRSSTSKSTIPSQSPSMTTTSDIIKSPTTRPLYSSKLGDQRVRSNEPTAFNSSARQPPQQKAWTQNKNPITGRAQPQASFNSNNKSSTSSLREGQRVRLTLVSGAEYEGTYAPGSDSSSCRLNRLFQKKLPNSIDVNGQARKEPIHMMSFQRKDITEAVVLSGNSGKAEGRAPNGNRTSFRTDAAISNSRFGGERPLQRWDAGSAGEGLEDNLDKSDNQEPWDQFKANNQLFGLQTDYNENIYTTEINKNHPEYKQRVARAELLSREIERTAPVTAHVAEERIMDFVGGDNRGDEEDKYSGVRRQQDFPPLTNRENKYTPPARRAPTGHTTVKGAPVDPAIISSQLKVAPSQKQSTPKEDESKVTAQGSKVSSKPTATPESKLVDSKVESNVEGKPADNKAAAANKPESKLLEVKPTDEKNSTPARPPATTSRTSPQAIDGPSPAPRNAPNATETVETDVLKSFKSFALRERQITEKVRTNKARQDKEVKLAELKNFANNFKLSTPVPMDLVSIIAKDPIKQKEIQEKALINAEEVAKQKAASEAAAAKEKEATAPKEIQPKTVADQAPAGVPAATTGAGDRDPRNTSRPAAPTHSSSGGMANRHPGGRSYNNNNNNNSQHPQYNNNYGRNNRPPPHMAIPNQPTGNLAQRLRNVEQQKMQHQHHMGPHQPIQDMRLPPTGPANSTDQSFGRRVSGVPPSYLGPKLNPNSHEFRPNAYAAPFNPAGHGPSQGSSPRSSVNPAVEAPGVGLGVPGAPIVPVQGSLIRRKTRAVDIKKCFILSHLETIQPLPGRSSAPWDDNNGLRPSFDTHPTWRQLDDAESLTYKEYFAKLPLSNSIATPNPSHVLPQNAHQYQLPFHLQHGSQNLAPRHSPHMPPMQIHGGQHGAPVPHIPYSAPDDHRMMHSNSAQSFASPRMGQVPMYAPAMNVPSQMQYNQQAMQPYMTPGAPPMGQFRSYSNNPQYVGQQPHQMGAHMMMQPQYLPPGGMVTAGPQAQLYPTAHPQFMPPGGVPPQPMSASNGFPSPGRPAAPMMVHQGSHQGSHQGQQPVYGMSPGMPYGQPAYTPQQAQGKFPTQRPQ